MPEGSGQAVATGSIFNGNDSADSFEISAGGDQGSWIYEFQLDGDPNWYTSTTTFLNAGETRGVTLRATTDASIVVGKADLTVAAQNAVYSASIGFRIFNGFPAVVLVESNDSVGPGTEGGTFEMALDAMLPTHDFLFFGPGTGPTDLAASRGYDAIIWSTGAIGAYNGANPINPEAAAVMEAYLAGSGNLLLSSLDLPSAGGREVATIFTNELGESNALRREGADGQRTILNTVWLKAICAPNCQGACCVGGGFCIVTYEQNCGDNYLGDGTVCDPNPRDPPLGTTAPTLPVTGVENGDLVVATS